MKRCKQDPSLKRKKENKTLRTQSLVKEEGERERLGTHLEEISLGKDSIPLEEN